MDSVCGISSYYYCRSKFYTNTGKTGHPALHRVVLVRALAPVVAPISLVDVKAEQVKQNNALELHAKVVGRIDIIQKAVFV